MLLLEKSGFLRTKGAQTRQDFFVCVHITPYHLLGSVGFKNSVKYLNDLQISFN